MDKKARRPDKTDSIDMRRAKVLDLHSKGMTVRDIADAIKIGKSTVQDDISIMRQEATEKIANFVESLPYEWTKAVTSFDRLLKTANDILEDESLEIDQKISVVKSISDLTEKRLALFSSPEIMKKSVEHVQKLKSRIEQLKKEQGSQWAFSHETEQEAGKPDKRKSRIIRKRQVIEEGPIV